MPVITISRMFGSGGSEIAADLSRRLQWALLDNAFVERVAVGLHVTPAVVEAVEERRPSLAERIADAFAFSSQEMLSAPLGAPLEWAFRELLLRDRDVREAIAALQSGIRPARRACCTRRTTTTAPGPSRSTRRGRAALPGRACCARTAPIRDISWTSSSPAKSNSSPGSSRSAAGGEASTIPTRTASEASAVGERWCGGSSPSSRAERSSSGLGVEYSEAILDSFMAWFTAGITPSAAALRALSFGFKVDQHDGLGHHFGSLHR